MLPTDIHSTAVGILANHFGSKIGGLSPLLHTFNLGTIAYYGVWILVLDFKKLHGTNHGLHSHEDVLKDEFDEPSFVLVRITGSVNDAHLFNKGGFSGFSRSCKDKI